MIPFARTILIATSVLPALVGAAYGNSRRHRHEAPVAAAPAQPDPPRPFMFYPQDIEGGVSGNLPFNNQIRKHTDPLNANGGR